MWWWGVYFQQQQQPHLWRCYWGLVAVVAQHGIECHQRLGSIQLRRYYYRVLYRRQETAEQNSRSSRSSRREKGRIDGIVARARGEEIHRREKKQKKKRSIRFSSFFSFGVIFRSPGVGSQLSHPLSAACGGGPQHIGMMK